jgi:hypothetical protein
MIDTSHDPDEALLTIIRGSLPDIDRSIPIGQVIARGRQLRRRRRWTKVTVGLGCVALTGAVATAGLPRHGPTLSAAGRPVNIDLAAWSVHTNADATVTVTVRNSDLRDPDRLRAVLAQAGIPASIQVVHLVVLHQGSQTINIVGCSGPGQDGIPQIIDVLGWPLVHHGAGNDTITIKPSAMPPGSVLSFVFWVLPDGTLGWQPQPDMSLHEGPPPPCVVPTTP